MDIVSLQAAIFVRSIVSIAHESSLSTWNCGKLDDTGSSMKRVERHVRALAYAEKWNALLEIFSLFSRANSGLLTFQSPQPLP